MNQILHTMKYLFTLLFAIFIISNSFAQIQKANINTSRSNIKKGLNNSADSLQQKANINTSRSNIKQPLNTPIDSLPQNKSYDVSHRLTRGTSSSIKRDGENPLDSIQQKANINTSRSNIKKN